MTPLTARKRAFGPGWLVASQICRLSELRRRAQPATLVDFRGSSLSDAGSIPAISTQARSTMSALFVSYGALTER